MTNDRDGFSPSQSGASTIFSVVTPTKNRASLLQRLHDSLLLQDFTDFEWIVVDDASEDDTQAELDQIVSNSRLSIRHFRQDSGHKKSALNRAVEVARGQMMVQIDDDDYLAPGALTELWNTWTGIPASDRSQFVGVTGLCARPDGAVMGNAYPWEPMDSTPQESTHRFGIWGDKFGCQRIDLLRRFPFPDDLPGLVPEGFVWNQIAAAGFKTRYVNRILRYCDDSVDGLTRNESREAITENSPGLLLNSIVLLGCWEASSGPAPLVRCSANVTRFSLAVMGRFGPDMLRRVYVIGNASAINRIKWFAVLGFAPLGAYSALRDRVRRPGKR